MGRPLPITLLKNEVCTLHIAIHAMPNNAEKLKM
jgi:hypothetical protein